MSSAGSDPEKPLGKEKSEGVTVTVQAAETNASGHVDQLDRQYSLLAMCAMALNIDSAWVAFLGGLVIATANGGPAGVIYELMTACVFYFLVTVCLAELASSVPSSGGVYSWASFGASARLGKPLGFLAGLLNFAGWLFDLCSIAYIPAYVCVSLYEIKHPDFVAEPWHSYLAYALINIVCCAIATFANRALPMIQNISFVLLILGGIGFIGTMAAAPGGSPAPSSSVWSGFEDNNVTGWVGGVAFLTGCLSGAFTIGTPDSITHLAEEVKHPSRNIPLGMLSYIITGSITSIAVAIAVGYGIQDITAVVSDNPYTFPPTLIILQATGSENGTIVLLVVILLIILQCALATYTSVSRIWWALARDNVTPFGRFFSIVTPGINVPTPSLILTSILALGFGAIQLGSTVAFTNLVSSFIVLTLTSYAIAIGANLLGGRRRLPVGWFHLGGAGWLVNAFTLLLIAMFTVFFFLPFAYPVTDASTMNWTVVIWGGIVVLSLAWYVVHGSRYRRPIPPFERMHGDEKPRMVTEGY